MWHRKATNKFRTHTVSLLNCDFSGHTDAIFKNVSTTDHYRKGKPYKLLSTPMKSSVEVSFKLGPNIPQNYKPEDINYFELKLDHCGTSSKAIIDILINDEYLAQNYSDAPIWNFGEQKFTFTRKMCKQGENRINIVLNRNSPAVYWLSTLKLIAHIDYNAVNERLKGL